MEKVSAYSSKLCCKLLTSAEDLQGNLDFFFYFETSRSLHDDIYFVSTSDKGNTLLCS